MRSEKELLIASKEFAVEDRRLSWWLLASTLVLTGMALAIALSDLALAVRCAGSVLAGLLAVRLFSMYHDYLHGAILRKSRIAGWLLFLYGLIVLNPRSIWVRSHDHHHKHNSKIFGANIGSFPTMTTDRYAQATARERLQYRLARHPITFVLAYPTIFMWGMSLWPFLRAPRRHLDGAVAVLIHVLLVIYLGNQGLDTLMLGLVVPMSVASSLGAYLFYAQHNFLGVRLNPSSEWSYVKAALHSSAYIRMNPVMKWLTGNIGYHHVHHLNARIPFYRLPEAMVALEEMRSPGSTSLGLRDIVRCLRLNLWSPEAQRFVPYGAARTG